MNRKHTPITEKEINKKQHEAGVFIYYKQGAHYLKAWTAVANNTAGAPGGGAAFWEAGAANGRELCLVESPHHCLNLKSLVSPLRWFSPVLELFLGCLGAVYWNDSFP